MKKIGITGSLASGKTTASKILSSGRGPLFSADLIVKKLYKKKSFINLLKKKLKIDHNQNFKKKLINILIKNQIYIKKIEKIIHPLVRKEMVQFTNKNKNRSIIFYEIPLLIESKLNKKFDVIIFIKAKKKIRLKRFKAKGGNIKLFEILNKKQLSDKKKENYCDHVVVNESNIKILKKNLLDIINEYE
tara:strand:+ start:24 stop:590 length:567 start_codon:yes stop_codon:yes gene_type:complete